MRLGVFCVMLGTAAIAAGSCASAQTPFEHQVLDALNAARTDPASYARGLAQYRSYFHANLLRYPGQAADIQTEEGVRVVDETIAFLDHQMALAPVQTAAMLEGSAGDLVADQRASGDTGHDSSDGSSPGDRAQKRGGGAYVAEVIAYGPMDAADVVRQLIIDDGVADRGHRGIIFAPELRFAGISCGSHPEYRTMCVIDMGITADGHSPDSSGQTASR